MSQVRRPCTSQLREEALTTWKCWSKREQMCRRKPMESFFNAMQGWAFILVSKHTFKIPSSYISFPCWKPANLNTKSTSLFPKGELPLSLAACTNQPDIVSFLMDNPHRCADVSDRDSQGNTVLHSLVVNADNTTDNTNMIASMYDMIVIQHNKLNKKVQLEDIENNVGLTPLKLAAKQGKTGVSVSLCVAPKSSLGPEHERARPCTKVQGHYCFCSVSFFLSFFLLTSLWTSI